MTTFIPILGCLPLIPVLLIASLALSAAGTAASLKSQHDQANAQEDYQTKLGAANVAAAQTQAEQARDQQAQTNESSARQAQQANVATQKAQSTATVAAGEAGVSGNSVDSLLRDFKTQEGVWKESLMRQSQLTDVSTGQQIDAIRANVNNSNLSMNAPIAQPNYLAGALSVGAQAAGAYASSSPKTTSETSGYNPNYFGGAARASAFK